MPRAALSQDEVDRFRDALCSVAAQRFAEHGYAGVTLRALAAELGCSPMTPYRYFANKAEIFEAVRSAAFERFADSQAKAAQGQRDPIERLRALGRAYVQFALDEPHAYRIMFELDPPEASSESAAEERPAEHRSWSIMHRAVEDAVASGRLVGTPDVLAHLYWSGIHGLVTLHLAGKLVLGRTLDELIEPWMSQIILASAPRSD